MTRHLPSRRTVRSEVSPSISYPISHEDGWPARRPCRIYQGVHASTHPLRRGESGSESADDERACDDSWDTTARLGFARDTVRALGELHDAGASDDAGGANEPMVHRNLSPRTILVKHDSSPILTGFERTRIPAAVTVASAGASSNEWDHAVAPEVRAQGRGAADRRSDVYSLCASLAVLFSEREDEASRKTV